MPKFTKRFVESIVPDAQKTIRQWDSELKGFGLIVLPSGRRTYCVQYRNTQRIQKMLKIGVHGQITTEEARTLARKYLSGVVHGHDPAGMKKTTRELPTLNDLAHDYILFHGKDKKPKSLKEDQRLLKTMVLPTFENSLVCKITRRDIESFHREHKETPYQANRAVSLLSKMFTLANDWGWREDNPAKGIKRYQEEKRKRWLTAEEMKILWKTLDEYSNQLTASLFRLLILTGARKGELVSATWDQFNLDTGVWTKPAHLTKQKIEHHLPLSPQAIEILKTMASQAYPPSPFLFPGKVEGKPIQEIKRAWETIRKKSGLLDVRIHDLRHTYASHLVSNGLSLSIVGALLGHTQASTTERYAHLADESLRQATLLFGNMLDNIIGKESLEGTNSFKETMSQSLQ